MRVFLLIAVMTTFAASHYSQTTTATRKSTAPTPAGAKAVDRGRLEGRVYRNETFRFEIAIPDGWLIADDKAAADLKAKGVDLKLKAPKAATSREQVRLNFYANRVTVLLTAFLPHGKDDNSMLRIAVEDLTRVPQVRDAVDYFDLMREGYRTMRLPADFKYSETQAEKLGKKQFGFIDTSTAESKTRIYATVRDGYAILFTINYKTPEHLGAFRDILANADFALK
ncbi:MAG: hypothetical protein ACK4S4_08115 [Pyrinomonadaceae bacterium]